MNLQGFFLMTKAIFIFIASFLLLLPIVSLAGQLSFAVQLVICLPFLLLLGIPHGAIDNILYLKNSSVSNFEFIVGYLIIIGFNTTLWLFMPNLAYLSFLLLSAYHFGQSQFSHYVERRQTSQVLLYLLWGLAILSGMLYFNIDEIQRLMLSDSFFAQLQPIHHEKSLFILFLLSTGLTVVMLAGQYLTHKLNLEAVLMELLILALILVCFYLMPLLIGFTLYFIILHSIKVLREEFQFLQRDGQIQNLRDFISTLAPFTLLSIVGILILFGLIQFNVLSISFGYCLLIVISSITLPHVFVMDRFYSRFFGKVLGQGYV